MAFQKWGAQVLWSSVWLSTHHSEPILFQYNQSLSRKFRNSSKITFHTKKILNFFWAHQNWPKWPTPRASPPKYFSKTCLRLATPPIKHRTSVYLFTPLETCQVFDTLQDILCGWSQTSTERSRWTLAPMISTESNNSLSRWILHDGTCFIWTTEGRHWSFYSFSDFWGVVVNGRVIHVT